MGGDTGTGRRFLWDLCAFLGMSVTGGRLGVRLGENLAFPETAKAGDLWDGSDLPVPRGVQAEIPHRMSHGMMHCLRPPPPLTHTHSCCQTRGLAWC